MSYLIFFSSGNHRLHTCHVILKYINLMEHYLVILLFKKNYIVLSSHVSQKKEKEKKSVE